MQNALDRHAAKVDALRRAVLESAAESPVPIREAAASDGELPPSLQGYAAKVRDTAWRIADSDIAALKIAGYNEDEIFEVTVAAALGAALRSFGAGMDLLRERPRDAARDP